ncbi:MAG: PEP-CTERM sorting domain-containing protein [Methylotenera sp.]|nr:PEP-CTERM sorting domain-containing protein [Methylotenera sp.]
MKFKSLCAIVFAFLTTSLPHYAFSAYQYTYTSEPFQHVENDFIRGHIYNISTDSFLKIVITSDIPLTTYMTEPLANATYDFTLEGFNYRAKYDGTYGDTFVASDLLIRDLGADGLPTSWYLNYTETYFRSPDRQDKDMIGFYADEELTQFGLSSKVGDHVQHIYAAGGAGQWQLSHISPVPEPSESVMFLAGLGMLGILARRKFKQS